jgi:hypothetical protein
MDIVVLEEDYSSEWASISPSFAIPKKNRTKRVVTDFRKNRTQLIDETSPISYSKDWGHDPFNGRVRFQSTDDTFIFDTGQGCGNCSIMWLLTFNILIRMISKVSIGARYSDMGHSEIFKAKHSVYVGDINTHQSNNGTHTNLINNMQHGFIIMFTFKEYSILK